MYRIINFQWKVELIVHFNLTPFITNISRVNVPVIGTALVIGSLSFYCLIVFIFSLSMPLDRWFCHHNLAYTSLLQVKTLLLCHTEKMFCETNRPHTVAYNWFWLFSKNIKKICQITSQEFNKFWRTFIKSTCVLRGS